jgi:hypothetical protein
MNDDYGQGALTIRLPMTMTKRLYAGLNFDEALFGLGDYDSSLQKKTRQGLDVSSTQAAACQELGRRLIGRIGLRSHSF